MRDCAAMHLFEVVEVLVGFEKSCSDAELLEMLHGLKKTDLTQLCMMQTKIEWKQAGTYRSTVSEMEEQQQRKCR